jgi:hypothetical protein
VTSASSPSTIRHANRCLGRDTGRVLQRLPRTCAALPAPARLCASPRLPWRAPANLAFAGFIAHKGWVSGARRPVLGSRFAAAPDANLPACPDPTARPG